MALSYKLEMLQPDDSPADDSVYIHLKLEVPAFQNRIGKEAYDALPVGRKSDFVTGLFEIDGVTEISSTAFRVWFMKAPSFQWDEVLPVVLSFVMTEFGESELQELPGSAKLDGTGYRLSSVNNRRKI